jgi:AcrR family transcriptional regulator
MKTRSTASGPRQSAEERRDAILDAAIAEFAVYGLHGTSTVTIAERVGISQPYIFRLFGTKKDLFLATLERVYDRITATFQAAAAADPDHALEAMGNSYLALIPRHELFLLLQAFAASGDPDVQKVARDRYAELYHIVARLSGADAKALLQFFAYGMLCTVAAAIDLPLLLDLGKEVRPLCDSE